MLNVLTRKLCPLMTLAIATVGCGKKISDSDTQPSHQTQNQELPSAYVIHLDGSSSSSKLYTMPRNGQFEIPERLKVRRGVTAGKSVELIFDANPYDMEDFQFKCTYRPLSNSEMMLNNCVDYDGDDFGNVTGHLFSLYKDDYIQIRFAGAAASDLSVEAVFNMSWR